MELLLAFLMSFGVVSSEDAKALKSSNDMDKVEHLVKQKELQKEFIIWEAEADDF